MANAIRFVRLGTDFRGLMVRAMQEWDRYLSEPREAYQWICVDQPEIMARALEILALDLPEEDLAQLVMRMPYLMILLQKTRRERKVPMDSMFALLSVLNLGGMITLLRQTSEKRRLAELFEFDARTWRPIVFMVGGKPDLDAPLGDLEHPRCLFFT